MITLSNLKSLRLRTICSLVSDDVTVADIGCDHGFVAIELVSSNKAKNAICTDLRKGPLMRAKAHIDEANLSDKIQCRLSDGLENIDESEVDCIIIAGMGGMLIKNILDKGIKVAKSAQELILSPQSDIMVFRKYLYENNFLITDEKMVFEENKYYQIIKAVPNDIMDKNPTDVELRYGKVLLKNKDAILKAYLEAEKIKLEKIYESLSHKGIKNRMAEINAELLANKEALSIYEMC